MYSCDNLLLSKMLKDGSYKELSLANGIANNIRTINYGNVEIDFPDGRGYIDYTYILKKNNIQYETISIKELKKLNDYTNIIILIPKEFLDYQEKINTIKAEYTITNCVTPLLQLKKAHLCAASK